MKEQKVTILQYRDYQLQKKNPGTITGKCCHAKRVYVAFWANFHFL